MMTLKPDGRPADDALAGACGPTWAGDSDGVAGVSLTADRRDFAAWLHDKQYSERTVRVYASYIERAALVLDLDTATHDDLLAWWRTMKDTAATRNQARKALIAYYRSLGRKRGEPADDLPARPERDALPKPVTGDTFAALIAAAHSLGGVHEAAGMLLAGTGCRINEARTARWDQFELATLPATWRIRGKGSGRKGEKERLVPLGADLVALLVRWHDKCGSTEHLFPTHHGASEGLLSDAKMRALIVDLAEVAGVERVTPHRYRHTVGSMALAATMDLRGVQELLGHENLNTTQRYTQVSVSRLQSIVDSLPT